MPRSTACGGGGAEIRLPLRRGVIQQTARGTWLVEAQGELIETPAVVLACRLSRSLPC